MKMTLLFATFATALLLSACGGKLSSGVAADLLQTSKPVVPAPAEKQRKSFIFDVGVYSEHASDRIDFLTLQALVDKGYASSEAMGSGSFVFYTLKDGVDGYGGAVPTNNIVVFPSKGSCAFEAVTGVSQNGEKGVIEANYACTNTATALYQVMHDAAMKAGGQKCGPGAYRPKDPMHAYDPCAVTEGPDTSRWTERYTFAATKWDTGWRLDEK